MTVGKAINIFWLPLLRVSMLPHWNESSKEVWLQHDWICMYFDRDTVGTKVKYVGTKGALAKEITLKGLRGKQRQTNEEIFKIELSLRNKKVWDQFV